MDYRYRKQFSKEKNHEDGGKWYWLGSDYEDYIEWLESQLQQSEKNIELFKKDEQLTYEAALETQQRIKQLESQLQQRDKAIEALLTESRINAHIKSGAPTKYNTK